MGRKYKRVFTLEAMIVSFFCAFIVGISFGSLVYVAIRIDWLAFGLGIFAAYAVLDVLMRSPNE